VWSSLLRHDGYDVGESVFGQQGADQGHRDGELVRQPRVALELHLGRVELDVTTVQVQLGGDGVALPHALEDDVSPSPTIPLLGGEDES